MNTPTDNNNTGKMKILEKSRRLNRDEGLEYAEKRGTEIGVIVYAIVSFILMAFSIPNRMDIVSTIAAISFAFVFGGTFSRYRFTKEKFYLIGAIASAFSLVTFTLMVVLSVMQ